MITLDEAMSMVLDGGSVDGTDLDDDMKGELRNQLSEIYGIVTGNNFSDKTGECISKMVKSGTPQDQAVAIALSKEREGKRKKFSGALKGVDPKLFCGIVKKFEGESAPATGSSASNSTPAAGSSEYHVPGAMKGFSISEGFNRKVKKPIVK